jgi:hypothetical protein
MSAPKDETAVRYYQTFEIQKCETPIFSQEAKQSMRFTTNCKRFFSVSSSVSLEAPRGPRVTAPGRLWQRPRAFTTTRTMLLHDDSEDSDHVPSPVSALRLSLRPRGPRVTAPGRLWQRPRAFATTRRTARPAPRAAQRASPHLAGCGIDHAPSRRLGGLGPCSLTTTRTMLLHDDSEGSPASTTRRVTRVTRLSRPTRTEAASRAGMAAGGKQRTWPGPRSGFFEPAVGLDPAGRCDGSPARRVTRA